MDEAEAVAFTQPARYRAFISYSHADSQLAGWLHRKLEGWKLAGGNRLAPVFIDRAELAAGPDLSASVREALANSAALIVIASPAARASQWVAQEIRLFRELHPDRPVLAALVAGQPDDAFPEALLQHQGTTIEPLAADFRAGRDGKRLALLKIVAGLTRQPLDRLVQRDAQSRQRRVMWITAGALLLSLILAAMLVVALRARAEADRQRAEAEGMVEFMLTDLRDKLKGVGRLDVMQSVNARAMTHYQEQRDLASLPDDMLLRRAKLLLAMGSDDLVEAGDDPAKAATSRRAAQEISEAWRETKHLLDANPNSADVVFAHAQSEFNMGTVGFYRKDPSGKRDLALARSSWTSYRNLAKRYLVLKPDTIAAKRELGYAEGALCSLEMLDKTNLGEARRACSAARIALEQAWLAQPHSVEIVVDFANQLAWEADANLASGLPDKAAALRRRQIALVEANLAAFPDDVRALQAAMLGQFGMAKLSLELKDFQTARPAAVKAAAYIARLRKIDDRNGDWQARASQIEIINKKLNQD